VVKSEELILLVQYHVDMVSATDILSLSSGVGGSYTKWQREPPGHKVYQVKLDSGETTVVTVYAENRALDDEDHPTITKIEEHDGQFHQSGHTLWRNLSENEQNAVRDALENEVKEETFF